MWFRTRPGDSLVAHRGVVGLGTLKLGRVPGRPGRSVTLTPPAPDVPASRHPYIATSRTRAAPPPPALVDSLSPYDGSLPTLGV